MSKPGQVKERKPAKPSPTALDPKTEQAIRGIHGLLPKFTAESLGRLQTELQGMLEKTNPVSAAGADNDSRPTVDDLLGVPYSLRNVEEAMECCRRQIAGLSAVLEPFNEGNLDIPGVIGWALENILDQVDLQMKTHLEVLESTTNGILDVMRKGRKLPAKAVPA